MVVPTAVASGNTGMEDLIPIVNRLHDVFTQMGPDIQFDLPQIAVVGGQSAGKSSVLENFVGRDFLPRGSGIVTRRPLILQLINSTEEYGEFLHAKGKRFKNFDEIRIEIETDTDRITGSNKGISRLPINLRIYSPHVLNITLIDLPGLTRNPIGDQPEDIEIQIRDMIFEYISKDTCLILAVTPANVDLGTSDALKLAKLADPDCERTIGVITKLDLMDAGTDAKQVLENKLLPLKRGYVGVVNRSQKDIDDRKNIVAAIEAEKRFFASHPAYCQISNKMGTPYLQQILNEQLTAHIRACLPDLRAKLRKEEASLASEVEKHSWDDTTFKTKVLHQMIHQLQKDFRESIRGYGVVNTAELSGGAKINYLFHEKFSQELARLTSDEEQLRAEISLAVRNSHGIEYGIFTPNMAFQTVVKAQIKRLKPPTLKCVEMVVKEFSKTMIGCLEKMKRYPKLYEEMDFTLSNYIQRSGQNCKDVLIQLLDSEAAYINIKHEEFIGFASNAHSEQNKTSPAKLTKPGQELVSHVIFKGYLSILDTGFIVKGAAKYYWFVLTAEFLAWYRDDSEVERKYKIPVQGLSIREESSRANAYSFSLFYSDGKPINKEFKQLALTCETREDLNNWKSGFQRAGIGQSLGLGQSQFHDAVSNGSSNSISEVNSFSDLQLDRQVETIRLLVDSYMNIVMRTSRDLVPKIIMNFLIQKTQDFIDQEILVQIQSQDLESLIAESKEESERRNVILRMYQACKKSLEIINEVSIATSSIASATSINHRVTQNGYLDKLTKVSREQRQTTTPPTPPVPRRPTNHGLASGSAGQPRSSSPNQIAG